MSFRERDFSRFMEKESFERNQELSREAIRDYYVEHQESKDLGDLNVEEEIIAKDDDIIPKIETKSNAGSFLEEAGYQHLVGKVENDLIELFQVCEKKGVTYALDIASKKDPLLFDILHDWLTKDSNYEKFLK